MTITYYASVALPEWTIDNPCGLYRVTETEDEYGIEFIDKDGETWVEDEDLSLYEKITQDPWVEEITKAQADKVLESWKA